MLSNLAIFTVLPDRRLLDGRFALGRRGQSCCAATCQQLSWGATDWVLRAAQTPKTMDLSKYDDKEQAEPATVVKPRLSNQGCQTTSTMYHVDIGPLQSVQHQRSIIFNLGLAACGVRPTNRLTLAHHRLHAMTKRSTEYHMRPNYTMPLHELPEESLVSCIDGSMHLGMQLASTSKVLRGQLQLAAQRDGLRLLVRSLHGDAVSAVLAAEGSCGLHVGEVIFSRSPLRVNELKRLLERCERLHTVRLSRHIGSSYEMFLTSIFRHQYPDFDLSRVTITTLPFISVRSSQRQLTELGFSRARVLAEA